MIRLLYSNWHTYLPILAGLFLSISFPFSSNIVIIILLALGLIGSVFSAVHHAEIIALKVGQPYGTVLLALAVTIIEVSLITSLMISGGEKESGLARDTIFAEIMIILGGMIGISTLIGGLKFREQFFKIQGISSTLIILVAMSVLTLILPNYTDSIAGPFYTNGQLLFVAFITLFLYGNFIIFQNVKHKSYFVSNEESRNKLSDKPTPKAFIKSIVFLVFSLGMVILSAQQISPDLEHFIKNNGGSKSLTGVIIAFIVLLPEGVSAIRAALTNNLQKSLNFSLGSALASIGLTIPVVALVSIFTGIPLSLGIDLKSTILFALTLLVITLSLSTGKTTGVEGVVLLVILAVYIFTIIIP